jgi:DNA-binding winged helix-turn-helix (wHTH) protein/TolB-like protein/Tfp pilus assembly protein PilF
MSLQTKHLYKFGPFVLDGDERVLLRDGQPVALTPKAFDTLLVLIEKSGRIVAKDELMSRVWPDSYVEESNLAFNISVLRKTLADGADEVQFIETVPKRGYRFAAVVVETVDDSAQVVVQRETKTRVVIEEESDSEGPTDRDLLATGLHPSQDSPLITRPRALAFCVLVLVAIAGAVVFINSSKTTGVRTIAVLPFKPLSASASDEYLELGMADALITRLSNLKQVIVRPTSSIVKYAGAGVDPIGVGRDLGVDSVLEGSVQKSGGTIRVTVRLLRVSDGVPIWADKFDESFTNIFSVQDSISDRMASALALNISRDERKRLERRHTDNIEAYQEFLKGRFYWSKWNGPSLRKAIEYFQQALEKDPQYALAYSGLADTHNLLGYLGITPSRESFHKSEETALKALALDDTLSEAHLSLAKVKLFYDWDWPGFERELMRSLELDPNYADAHGMYGAYLIAMGKSDQAIAERKRAQELDPLTPLFNTSLGWAYFYAGRYDEAIDWYKKSIELDTNFVQAHNDLGNTLLLKGMDAEAIEELLRAKTITGTKPEIVNALRRAYDTSGMRGYWQKELELANEQLKQGQVNAQRMARIYTELGEKDRAVEWLEKCYEERNSLLIFLRANPVFQSLHSHPKFVDLLRRIGLA